MGKPKHRKDKPKRRRWRPRLWRQIFRYYVQRAKARARGLLLKTAGPKEIARASQDYDKDGTYIRPVLRPYFWNHYVAPEDLERYAACIGGWEFEFELLPEGGETLQHAAYDAAAEHFGPYVDSQPLEWIEPLNDRARAVLAVRTSF